MELNELLNSVDIVKYISQFVDLEQKGNEWWGLSCFKEEKTPSFSVRQEPPVFYDYSSGIGGNLYTFVRKYFNCSGRRAVEIIKEYAGYDGEIQVRSSILEATTYCKRFLPKQKTEKSSTGTILSDNYMDRYEARDDKLAIWEREGIPRATLDKFQVRYDAFSDRLVYPIRNLSGQIVNVSGRTLDPDYKEKKLRKYTYFFKWGTLDVLFGLFENKKAAIKQQEIIVFEGCKSVMLADSWGIHNTCCLLTSHLNPRQMMMLIQLGCRVVFALDKDVNVRKDENIRKLKDYLDVYIITDRNNLLDEKDSPVDKGQEIFRQLYDKKVKFI